MPPTRVAPANTMTVVGFTLRLLSIGGPHARRSVARPTRGLGTSGLVGCGRTARGAQGLAPGARYRSPQATPNTPGHRGHSRSPGRPFIGARGLHARPDTALLLQA